MDLQSELNELQMQLSQKRTDRHATKRSVKKLEHKIQYLKDDLEPLKRREKRAYQKASSAYYKSYSSRLEKWKKEKQLHDTLSQQKALARAMRVKHERSRQERLRFVERIRKDIERIFTFGVNAPIYRVFWRVLPAGEWTFDSVLKHYTELHRAYPHIHFEVDRLRRVFSLNPSSLYIGIDEFDWYIVCAFSQTTKVVLECPIYGNAIYVIRENWQSLSKLPKNELLSQFPSYVHRIVHAGDWYPLLRAELFA